MNHDKRNDSPGHLERPAFGALWALLLAPIMAQGLWRPLVHVFGPSGTASAVTYSALAVTGTIAVVQVFRAGQGLLLSLAMGGLFAIGASVGLSLGLPGLLTLLGVASAMALLLAWLPPQLPSTLDGLARRHKILFSLYVVLALASVVKTAQLSIFMGDSARVEQQTLPGEKFVETHSCLTAYVHADTLSRKRVDNLYAEHFWLRSHGLPPAPSDAENPYRPFLLDYYAYPPPFLFVMAPLAPLSGDFPAQRALWFGINGILLAVGLWIIARWIGGPSAHRTLLLAPLLFGSLPVLVTLQIGNFQIAVVVISVLAMVAFERDRPVLGGALLAFAILSKISPGVLGIALWAQRRFRSAAWTAGFGVVFLVMSVWAFGVNPIKFFLTYTLPHISSGQAFAFMDDTPLNIVTNMAPFGLPFKIQLAGLSVGDPWALARRLGRLYSIVLAILVAVALRRAASRRSQAITWMSLLVLASLQSPFAPGYTIIGLLWAMTLLAASVRGVRGAMALLLLALLLLVIPPATVGLRLLAIFGLLQSALAVGVPIWLLTRAAASSASGTP